MDTLSGHTWQVVGILFLLAATCRLLNLGGFLTVGPIRLFVSLTLFIMLGAPASGVPVGTNMASGFYQFRQPYLPTSAALDALKRLVYFDGHGVGPGLLTMAVSLAIGVALVLIGTIRQKSEKKPLFRRKSRRPGFHPAPRAGARRRAGLRTAGGSNWASQRQQLRRGLAVAPYT
ncbi:hypothetical protein [Nocardia salmonicida]|uniref:hypothetical protein n=1 Tax=Nocardia salmonicida TaxID=53431 RepID=UPI00340B7D56